MIGNPKTLRSWLACGLVALVQGVGLVLTDTSRAAVPASDWRYLQEVPVPQAGLQEMTLPNETLDAARSDLVDLRLLDPAGNEISYYLDRSLPEPTVLSDVKTFQTTLQADATVLHLETGFARPMNGVLLVSPAPSFLKSVQLQGSRDGVRFETLATGQLVFRQSDGASQLFVPVAPAVWPFLRITIDDQRSRPVPFSGAKVQLAASEPPTQSVPVALAQRTESPGETRLLLQLPAAHLQVARLHFQTAEPLLTREVSVSTRRLVENAVEDVPVASGVIYRLAMDGAAASSNMAVQVQAGLATRDLTVLIRNHDSPPLQISAVTAECRPVKLVFLSSQAGVYRLLSGNRQASAPRYDLAGLANRLQGGRATLASLGPLSNNPAYHEPETLPEISQTGTPLDVRPWKYRKAILAPERGVLGLDLDLEVLSKARNGFEDLRIVHSGVQVPYVIDRTPWQRTIAPAVALTNDSKRPSLSRWSLTLPEPSLPLLRLVANSPAPLFERRVQLTEELADERGDTYRRVLGERTWIHTPSQPTNQLAIAFSSPPETARLLLEIENADNPPVPLQEVQVYYPVTRLLFKVVGSGDLFLYYGNKLVDRPHYDLALVAQDLEAAPRKAASLQAQETLIPSAWTEDSSQSGTVRVLFWVVLVLVIGGLLLVMTRLLPRQPPSAN